MSWWTLGIYGGAALLGVQGLLSLMVAHHRATLQKLMDEEQGRIDAEARAASIRSAAEEAAALRARAPVRPSPSKS